MQKKFSREQMQKVTKDFFAVNYTNPHKSEKLIIILYS